MLKYLGGFALGTTYFDKLLLPSTKLISLPAKPALQPPNVPTKYDELGNPIFTSAAHRKQYCETIGLLEAVDREHKRATLRDEDISALIEETMQDLGQKRFDDIARELQDYDVMAKLIKCEKVEFEGGMEIRHQVMVENVPPVSFMGEPIIWTAGTWSTT